MGKPRKPPDLAQVGAGDPAVLAGPGFRRFPPCLYALRSEAGSREYDTIGRMFYQRGRLTLDKHRELSEYALHVDTMQVALETKLVIRPNRLDQIRRARRLLGLDDIDKPIAAPEDAPVNKFAQSGFSARRR